MKDNQSRAVANFLYLVRVVAVLAVAFIVFAIVFAMLTNRSLAAEVTGWLKIHFVGEQPVESVNLIVRPGYAAVFDEKRRATTLCAFHITKGNLNAPKREKKFATFHVDAGVSPAEYNGSGYERGHLMPFALAGIDADKDGIPAGEDRDDAQAAMELNLMTNIVAQSRAVNGPTGLWYRLEQYIQDTLLTTHKELWVYCGSIYGPGKYDEIGKGIEVAPLFFMIVAYRSEKKDRYHSMAWLIPHIRDRHDFGPDVIGETRVSIDLIEALTGLDFFKGVKIDEAYE